MDARGPRAFNDPRPRKTPSTTSPAKGGNDQDASSTGHTSRPAWRTSPAGAPRDRPANRATTLDRPGAGSTTSTSRPTPSRKVVRVAALRASPPDPSAHSLTQALATIAPASSAAPAPGSPPPLMEVRA